MVTSKGPAGFYIPGFLFYRLEQSFKSNFQMVKLRFRKIPLSSFSLLLSNASYSPEQDSCNNGFHTSGGSPLPKDNASDLQFVI